MILERGDVFFLYRPRVRVDEVRSLDDVQRFYMVLEPDSRRRLRELILGRKRLPSPGEHEREWAFVARVASDPAQLPVREPPPAQAAGEGRYAIVEHDGHTHFAYTLELPERPGPVQEAFRIGREASYIVAVRNPEADAPPGVGLRPDRRADFPPELRERFRGRRFDPPDLLDYEGTEIVLIGAAADAAEELGIEWDADTERLRDADLFRDLRLRPSEPLKTGRWA
jgi:hypothetical protein